MSIARNSDILPPSSPAISAHGLTLAYGSVRALVDADFVIPTGTTVALIGPNGSGKSTLLRAIAGLSTPRSGTLEVTAGPRPGGVSLVLQSTDVDRSLSLSVGETLQMARYPHLGLLRRAAPADREIVERALERVELAGFERRQLHELSGGQRQRVLVAQGLAQDAELLLLDEPFTGLDVVSKETILRVIDDERAAGHTVVFSTHDLGEARRADLVLLVATRQIAVGPPEEVLCAEHLEAAFGGRLLRLDDGIVVVDDPHHEH